MTEDIELLKKQYAALKKQRDDYKHMLVDLMDKIYSGCYNNFDLPDEKIRDEEGNSASVFHGWDKFRKALRRGGYFHIGRLVDAVKEYKLALDHQPNKAELDTLLEKWKLPEEIEQYLSDLQNMNNENPISIEQLATMLIVFSHEYDFTKKYPGDEPQVYSDAFAAIVRGAMKLAKIPCTPEGIENALKEAYSK